MLWFVLGVLLLVYVYLVLVKQFTYWEKRGIVQYKFWKIWIQTIVEIIKQPSLTDGMQTLYNDFLDERYVGSYQFFTPRLCVKDPELIKQIFVKDFDHFVDHTMFIPTDGDPVLEHTLFTLTGEKWRHMRGIASPSFTSSKMKIMYKLMLEHAAQFMKYLENQDSEFMTIEMKDLFSRITSDVFASTHFGVECDSLKVRNNEFYTTGLRGTDFAGIGIKLRFILITLFPKITKVFGLKFSEQGIIKFFKKVVSESIQIREKHGIVRPDLIHHLKETKKNNEKFVQNGIDSGFAVVKESFVEHKETNKHYELSDEEITAMAASFFGAGFDSVSTALSFAAYELALHPDIQEKLQAEIDYTLSNCEGALTYETLLNMKYLDMVISETLRKWPGGFFLDRLCIKPYTIQPVKVGEKPLQLKPGDAIWLPLFALQRDPQFYPNPERFDPERFSNENKANINPYTFMPFGIGPRHCIGNRFALLEMKVVMFHILAKFSITVVDKTPIPIRLDRRYFQLASKDNYWLGLKRRKQTA